jgi:hypothetical protein
VTGIGAGGTPGAAPRVQPAPFDSSLGRSPASHGAPSPEGIGRGAHSNHELSVVGYLGIIAGVIVAVAGSIAAAAGKSEAG